MALLKSAQVAGYAPLINADGANDLVPMFGDFTVPAGGLAVNDVIEMTGLPAGYVLVDAIIDHDDFGTTLTADFGFLSGDYNSPDQARTCNATLLVAADLAAAAGIKRPTVAGFTRIAPLVQRSHIGLTSGDRGVGFVVKTAAGVTVGARIRMTLYYRAQINAA
jgi:hypothetical protein